MRSTATLVLVAGLSMATGQTWAQTDTNSSSSTSADSSSSSDTPVSAQEYTKPKCKGYDWYEARLLDNHPSGKVIVDCAIAKTGDLTSCQVISESSPGAGKVVAETFLCFAQIDATMIDIDMPGGARKKFTYLW